MANNLLYVIRQNSHSLLGPAAWGHGGYSILSREAQANCSRVYVFLERENASKSSIPLRPTTSTSSRTIPLSARRWPRNAVSKPPLSKCRECQIMDHIQSCCFRHSSQARSSCDSFQPSRFSCQETFYFAPLGPSHVTAARSSYE